jgi:uncharacterized protein (DUF362 family)/Pyruvate/2-oxoacid:ferredoxin oxidoreductase delta subunit
VSVVSAVACETYEPGAVRQALSAVLAPLGGMGRFVRPGMQVLLKPNLLTGADLARAITTHPSVVQAVAELVREAGGTVLVGDSPAGPVAHGAQVYHESGMAEVAARTGARLVPFDSVAWRHLNGNDYFIARPVFEADLVINLPKLKTHMLTLYTGAVKNLFGTIPGTRKREVHCSAPGVKDFSHALVDVLELVRPGLTLMDGVRGQEGNGPGNSGTPRPYGCLAASADPVALDAVMTGAMGYRPGAVLHLAQAGARGLGAADPGGVRLAGERQALDFGAVRLPQAHWYLNVPSWMSAPLSRAIKVRPRLAASACAGCGDCAEVCPREAITPGHPPVLDLERCVGCFCCAEVCPQGAITPRRSLMARLVGV